MKYQRNSRPRHEKASQFRIPKLFEIQAITQHWANTRCAAYTDTVIPHRGVSRAALIFRSETLKYENAENASIGWIHLNYSNPKKFVPGLRFDNRLEDIHFDITLKMRKNLNLAPLRSAIGMMESWVLEYWSGGFRVLKRI